MTTGRGWIMLGAVMAAAAVAAGAFGAHGLRARVEPPMLEVWETAARYHMYHALAMILLGIIVEIGRMNAMKAESIPAPKPHKALSFAGWLFLAGIALFSGSLYAMTLTGAKWLGPITPLGGMAFIVGWVCLAIGAWPKVKLR